MQFQSQHSGSIYKIGAWNVNGFYSTDHPENSIFKHDVLCNLDQDIYFISETFCKNDDTFYVKKTTNAVTLIDKIYQNGQ